MVRFIKFSVPLLCCTTVQDMVPWDSLSWSLFRMIQWIPYYGSHQAIKVFLVKHHFISIWWDNDYLVHFVCGLLVQLWWLLKGSSSQLSFQKALLFLVYVGLRWDWLNYVACTLQMWTRVLDTILLFCTYFSLCISISCCVMPVLACQFPCLPP